MAWRKWLVRTLVFSVVAGLAVVAVVYQRWTNPTAVRLRVIEHLGEECVGAVVTLESASLRLLGGIAISDLRLARKDDPDRAEFLYVPSGIIYHDKEQILDGKLAIRRVELYRPRLRVLRNSDGTWNLGGILGPAELNRRLPILVIEQGTILLEDHRTAPDAPPVELHDVNLTLVNDPLPTLAFEASARLEPGLGTIHLRGSRQRESEETAVTITAADVPIGPALVQRLATLFPETAAHARQLEGVANLHASLNYRPGTTPALTHDVHLQVSKGKLSHARLPLPLEQLEASVHCVNGAIASLQASACSGPTRVRLTAHDLDPDRGPYLKDLVRDLDLQIDHLDATPELFERLPPCLDDLKDIHADYRMEGPANVHFTFQREPSGRWLKHCVVKAEGARACFVKFPYPVDGVTGTIDVVLSSDRDDHIHLDLAGRAGTRPIYLKGDLTGRVPYGVALDIWGDNLPLDDKILAALRVVPGGYEELARQFHPQGRADFRAFIRRPQGTHRHSKRFLIAFHDCSMRYDVFPYPLENVSGVLDIQPDHWSFSHFHGTHKGGEVWGSGRSVPAAPGPPANVVRQSGYPSAAPPPEPPAGLTLPGTAAPPAADEKERDRLEIEITGRNLLLDGDMADALRPDPDLLHTWNLFAPAGRVDAVAKVVRSAGVNQHPDVDLTVYPKGCTIRPDFFRYALDDLRGKVHYANRWVEVDRVTARHGTSNLSLESGDIYLKPTGGCWARLTDLRCRPLLPDGDFVRALPETLRQACSTLDLHDPVALKTLLVIDTDPKTPNPVIYWDGSAHVRNASIRTGLQLTGVTGQVACRGLHDGGRLRGVVGNFLLDDTTVLNQPLRHIQGQLRVEPDTPQVLRLPGLRAQWFGGEIYGPLRVEFSPVLRYETRLTASQVKLEEFGRLNVGGDLPLSGLASASLYLSGQGTDWNELNGNGSIDVPDGKMYNLPLLLDLLKVIGLRAPDRTAFEEMHASFDIHGPRVTVNRLDLFGNAISLRGAGEMNLDGTDINLNFHADWARITQALPPGIKQIPPALSNQLLTIKMHGKLGDIQCTKEPMPVLFDPLKRMWDEMRGPAGEHN
jgi:hypothetical protein